MARSALEPHPFSIFEEGSWDVEGGEVDGGIDWSLLRGQCTEGA